MALWERVRRNAPGRMRSGFRIPRTAAAIEIGAGALPSQGESGFDHAFRLREHVFQDLGLVRTVFPQNEIGAVLVRRKRTHADAYPRERVAAMFHQIAE